MLKQVAGRHSKKFRPADDNKFNPNKFNINNKLRNIFPLQCSFSLHKNNRSTPRKSNRLMYKNNKSNPKAKIQREHKKSKTDIGLDSPVGGTVFGSSDSSKPNRRWRTARDQKMENSRRSKDGEPSELNRRWRTAGEPVTFGRRWSWTYWWRLCGWSTVVLREEMER
jgi:hypothetical protein